MMRKLFIASTLLFWLAMAYFWLAGRNAPEPPPTDPIYTLAEVAKHNTPEDCWMTIDGQVYDLGTYLPRHPAPPAIMLPWCGKEASQAYRTKTIGRPHSSYADQLLATYRIGALAP